MATEVKVPTLGESVTEASIGELLKNVGDAVAVDEVAVSVAAAVLHAPPDGRPTAADLLLGRAPLANFARAADAVDASGAW